MKSSIIRLALGCLLVAGLAAPASAGVGRERERQTREGQHQREVAQREHQNREGVKEAARQGRLREAAAQSPILRGAGVAHTTSGKESIQGTPNVKPGGGGGKALGKSKW